MPEQYVPNVFQSDDSVGIWQFDPGLAMILAFVIVPIAMAILCLALQACGRLLRGGAAGRLATSQAKNRFEVPQHLQTAARLERRRCTAPQLKAHAAYQFRRIRRRRRHRPRTPSGSIGRWYDLGRATRC